MILNLAMSTKKPVQKLRNQQGWGWDTSLAPPRSYAPCLHHKYQKYPKFDIISIISIQNLTSVPGRVNLVGIIGYLSNYWVFSKILLIPARRCRILVSWSSTSKRETKQHVSSPDNSHSTWTTTLNRGHLWYLQKTRPSVNYAKYWLDQSFPFSGWKRVLTWMWWLGGSKQSFSTYFVVLDQWKILSYNHKPNYSKAQQD